MTSAGALMMVNYHYVRDPAAAPHPGIHPIAPDVFAEQVGELAARFHMAEPDEAAAFLTGEGTLAGPSVLITFDDGLVDHARAAADVLDPLGVRGVFFVPSRPLRDRRAVLVHKVHWLRAHTEPTRFHAEVDAAMPPEWTENRVGAAARAAARQQYIYDSPGDALLKFRLNFLVPPEVVDEVTSSMLAGRGIDEAAFCDDLYVDEGSLKDLTSRGHAVGAHGHSHTPFARMSQDDLEADVRTNVGVLAEITGERPEWVSYPHGRDGALPGDTKAFCAEFGFRVGVTIRPGWNRASVAPSSALRFNTNEIPAIFEDIKSAGAA